MFDLALQEAGFLVSKEMFPIYPTLVALQGDQYFSLCAENSLSGYRKEMRRPNITWSDFTQAMFQYRVLGVDSFFSFEEKGSPCTLGVAVTLNPWKVDGKLYHLTKMRPALSHLGVSGCIVLLVEHNGDACWSAFTQEEKKHFLDEVFNMAEAWHTSKSWVIDYTISL